MTNDRHYHVERARQEFDAAYRADRLDIAAIHLRLAGLHMEQARGWQAAERASATPVQLDPAPEARFIVADPL